MCMSAFALRGLKVVSNVARLQNGKLCKCLHHSVVFSTSNMYNVVRSTDDNFHSCSEFKRMGKEFQCVLSQKWQSVLIFFLIFLPICHGFSFLCLFSNVVILCLSQNRPRQFLLTFSLISSVTNRIISDSTLYPNQISPVPPIVLLFGLF